MEYVGDFPGLSAGDIVVRVLLLLWTRDYPAQCEVGKFIKCEKQACRRDKVTGDKQISSTSLKHFNVLVLKNMQTLARHKQSFTCTYSLEDRRTIHSFSSVITIKI